MEILHELIALDHLKLSLIAMVLITLGGVGLRKGWFKQGGKLTSLDGHEIVMAVEEVNAPLPRNWNERIEARIETKMNNLSAIQTLQMTTIDKRLERIERQLDTLLKA